MLAATSIGTNGRLGNQLFQYSALRAMSLRNNWTPALRSEMPVFHGQVSLLGYFNIPSRFRVPVDEIRRRTRPSIWKERCGQKCDPEFFSRVQDGDDICGYFENTGYFEDQWDVIRHELAFKDELDSQARDYVRIVKNTLGADTLVSIHVRRGDRAGYFTRAGLFGVTGESLDPESRYGRYLEKARKRFPEEVGYLVFSGGSRTPGEVEDIDWCRRNIRGERVAYQAGVSDILDFAVMSRCDHNILSHHSTFGWWAAFLNPNPERVAIAPADYFLRDRPPVPAGYFPKSFTVI